MATGPDLFDVAADSYDRLIGRYLPTLGPAFADVAGVAAGQRVLDVGCGPGGLTTVLVERVGAGTSRPSARRRPSSGRAGDAIPGSTCARAWPRSSRTPTAPST